MLIQQVREVMTVNQELKDESSWIWLLSEQMVFLLRSEFAKEDHGEAGISKQCNDQRTDQTAFFLAPIITDFIRNTQRELYDEKLQDALDIFENIELPAKLLDYFHEVIKATSINLDLEWSKGDNTKTQCNRLNTSPLHQENTSNKNGPARVKRRIKWEAPSKPLAVDDPLLLPRREVHAKIGINWA